MNGISFSGQDGTVFCSTPVEFPAQLVTDLASVRGVHSIVADRTCRVLRAPTVDGSSTAAPGTTTTLIWSTTTLGSSSSETTTTEALPVNDDELLVSVLESDPVLTTMSRLLTSVGFENRLSGISVLLAPVDGAFDQLGADLLAEIESESASTIALVNSHMLDSVESSRVELIDGVTTIDGYAQVIDVLEVGGRQIWLIDTVLQADGTGVPPLLQVRLSSGVVEALGASLNDDVLRLMSDLAEKSGRSFEPRIGPTVDVDTFDLFTEVISVGAVQRILTAMLDTLDTGELTVSEAGISINGIYLDETRAAAMEAVARSVGAEVLLAPQPPVTEGEVDALNDEIAELLAGSPVSFVSGRAEFVWGSDSVLERVAQLLIGVPGIDVVVRGHTDSDGVLASNLQLSADRAAAVASELIGQGVERSIVSSEGVGSAEPIIVEGVEDKVLSRRVEIVVSVA